MQNCAFFITIKMFLLLCFLPLCISAQQTVESMDEQFVWNDTDETKTILVQVQDGSPKLKINLEGKISKGDLVVSAYDPEGNKVSWFSLKSSGAEGYSVSVDSGGSPNSVGTGSSSSSSSSSMSRSDGSGVAESTVSSGRSTGRSTVKVKSKVKRKGKDKSKSKSGNSVSKTSTTTDAMGAKGIMTKTIDDPMAGNWKVVLDLKEVSGSLTAKISQD